MIHRSPRTNFRFACFGRWSAAACVSVVAGVFCTFAQAAPGLTAQQEADRAAIQNYPLSMDVMHRIEHVGEAASKAHLPCMGNSDPGSMRSLDAMAHEIETKEPRAVPILASNGFTPKQYATAMLALMNTGLAAEMLAHPDSPFAKGIVKGHHYNTENVAFYNAHRTQIDAIMKKLDSEESSCGN